MGMTGINYRYQRAEKPIKVPHFHPNNPKQYSYMVEGKNDLNIKIVNEILLNILKTNKLC